MFIKYLILFYLILLFFFLFEEEKYSDSRKKFEAFYVSMKCLLKLAIQPTNNSDNFKY